MTKRILTLCAIATIVGCAWASSANAQIYTVYQPVVAAPPTVTYYQPATPVTTMYAPARIAAPIPVVTNYAPAPLTTTYYAPAPLTTTYYAPAPVATTVLSPVAPVAYAGEVWEYNPARILPRRRWRRVY